MKKADVDRAVEEMTANRMRHRTKELAEQAGFVLWPDGQGPFGEVIDWASSYDMELEKFAELVRAEKREWVGLTKDEVNSWELPVIPTVFEFAKFIEAKLKEKNSG